MQPTFDMRIAENRLGDALAWAKDCFRRRWRMFCIVVTLIVAVGAAFIMKMEPVYEGIARIRVDPARDPLMGDVREEQASLSLEAIQTEVGMLRSSELSLAVVYALNLTSDPEFSKNLPRNISDENRAKLVSERVLNGLNVSRSGLTYIIEVSFLSGSAEKASLIANAFVDAYFDRKLQLSTGTAARQAEFFNEQLLGLGRDAKRAEAELARFRGASGLLGVSGRQGADATVDQQIAPLSTQIAEAESAAAAAQAAYSAASQQSQTASGSSAAEIGNSPVIADLRRTRGEILQNLAAINSRYGENHPESLRLQEQLRVVDAQIRSEAERIIITLRADAQAAQARVQSLRGKLNSLEAQRRAAARASVVAKGLESEAEAKRKVFDRVSDMSLASSQAANNPLVQAEIVDRASVPSDPVAPDRPLLFSLLGFFALGLGAGTVALRESLSSGLRTSEDIERKLGIPLIAALPNLQKRDHATEQLLEPTVSPFSEALRIAATSLSIGDEPATKRVIAFPSSLPAEGKSTIALAFAGLLATNGRRTLLLECDIRRAGLWARLTDESKSSAGLVEVLNGIAELKDALIHSENQYLDFLLVRSQHFTTVDMFGDGRMQLLLDQLKEHYDNIVLDIPPVIGLADSRSLAALADINVLVVRWDHTPLRAVQSALSSLQRDGVQIDGAIFSMVSHKAEVIGSLYYGKKYSNYYSSY